MPDLSELLTAQADRLVIAPVGFEALQQRAATRRRRRQVLAAAGAAVSVTAVAVLASAPLVRHEARPSDRPPACDLHARNPQQTNSAPDRATPLSDAEARIAAVRQWQGFGSELPAELRPNLEGVTPRILRLPYSQASRDYLAGGGPGESLTPASSRCVTIVTVLTRSTSRRPLSFTALFDTARASLLEANGGPLAIELAPVPNREQIRRILLAVDRVAARHSARASRVVLAGRATPAFTLPGQQGPWLSQFGSWVARVDLVGPTREAVDLIIEPGSLRVLEERRAQDEAFPAYLGQRYEIRPLSRVLPLSPVTAPACAARDLKGRIAQASKRGAERAYLLAFQNRSATRCQLAARPTTLTGIDQHGQPVAVSLEAWAANQDSRNAPAAAAPGDAEHLIVLTLDATCPTPPLRLQKISVSYPDGVVPLPGDLVVCADLALVSPPAGPGAVLGGL